MHANAAAVIRAGDPTPDGALRAAHHALGAAGRSPADRAAALDQCTVAAAGLMAGHAFADADDLLARAVAMARSTGDGRVPATLLRDRAHAVMAAGRVAEAHDRYTEAVRAAAAEEGDPVLVAEAAVGLGGLWMNNVRSPVEQRALLRRLRAARAGLPAGHDALALRLDARIAAAEVFWETGRPEGVLDVVARARRSADADVRLEVLSNVHTALLGPDWTDLRRELAEEMVDAAGDVSAGVLPLMARCWRTVDLFLAGDPGAGRALADLRAPAEALQCVSVLYIVRLIDVMLTIRSGRLEEAEVRAAEALELGRRAEDADAFLYYGIQLVTIRWLQGRDEELIGLVEEMADSPERPTGDGSFDAAAAALAARADRPDLARRYLQRVTDADCRLGDEPRFSTWTGTMCGVIEAAVALGDTEVAGTAGRLLAPYADLPVSPSLAVTCFGAGHRFVGVAARAVGDLDDAVAHLEAAIAADVRLGHRPAAARARADLAEALVQRAGTGDRARAVDLWDRAIADGAEMGMDPLVERWRSARAAAGAAPAEPLADHVVIRRGDAAGWVVAYRGERVVVADRAGIRHLAQLTGAPRTAVPALDLATASGRPAVAVGRQPVLDGPARRALEQRAHELAAAVAAARERGDDRRQRHLEDELDALAAELRGNVGPGGRARAFTDDGERARTAVRKAILRSIAEIERALPAAGEHLRATITTGTACCYTP